MKLCKPLRSPAQSVLILAATGALSLISVAVSRLLPGFDLYFQVASAAFLALGVALLYRYSFTEFVYVLSDRTLTVRRILGKRDEAVFSVELCEGMILCRGKAELKKQGCSGGVSYRQNLSAFSAYIVYEKDSRRLYAEFEPNGAFYALVEEAMKS